MRKLIIDKAAHYTGILKSDDLSALDSDVHLFSCFLHILLLAGQFQNEHNEVILEEYLGPKIM